MLFLQMLTNFCKNTESSFIKQFSVLARLTMAVLNILMLSQNLLSKYDKLGLKNQIISMFV